MREILVKFQVVETDDRNDWRVLLTAGANDVFFMASTLLTVASLLLEQHAARGFDQADRLRALRRASEAMDVVEQGNIELANHAYPVDTYRRFC